mgnify:CR=1 FL=1
MKSTYLLCALSIALASPSFASDTEQLTRLSDQTSLAVTIYNDNIALVKDQRTLTLDHGLNHLAFRGVSAKIRPETAILRSLDSSISLQVLEQNFDYDLLTPQKLLEKYTGKQVQISRTHPVTGERSVDTVTVLSTNNGIVIKMKDQILINPVGEYIFNNVPDNLRDQPTLVTQLTSSSQQQQTIELGYLTGGLSWKSDYVAELSNDDSHLDLTGWVTLTNQSGTAFNNAQLQLVAGDVNQVQPQTRNRSRYEAERMMKMQSDAPLAEENLFEYHLYSLARPTNLANNQTKQVALLSATSVPVTKQFILQGNPYYYSSRYTQLGEKIKVGVFVEFENSEQSHLGIPIPKGIIRVYKNDSKGNAQFVGEDRIAHSPKNETIQLKLGDAFDISANKKQTDFKTVRHSRPYNSAHESGYEIELNNAKSEAITVTVREPIPGDWEIISQSHPHTKVTAGMAEWNITIPAESSHTLRYQVLVQY